MTDKQLPPDCEGMNDDRAEWADRALQAFQMTTGTDREDALADLLCDLMHLCDRDSSLGDFASQLARAESNYSDETMADPTEAVAACVRCGNTDNDGSDVCPDCGDVMQSAA